MYPNWLTYCLISSIRDSELFAFLSIKLDSISRGQVGYLISNNMGTTNLALSDKFGYSGVVYIFPGTLITGAFIIPTNNQGPTLIQLSPTQRGIPRPVHSLEPVT